MVTNFGMVVGVAIGALLLLGGLVLMRRGSRGGSVIALGALAVLAAEVYGLFVLRPFVGRPFDEQWHAQVSTVETAALVGLFVCALGVLVHAFTHPPKHPYPPKH